MQNKTERDNQTSSSNAPIEAAGVFGLFPPMHTTLWNIANYLTTACATSAGIILIQSPMKTFLLNKAKNNRFMPYYEGGLLGFFRALYAGTSLTVYSSATRTAYVTGTMNNKPESSIKEETFIPTYQLKVGAVMAYSLGDMVLTQVPDSLSQLKKLPKTLPANFIWYRPYNINKLMFNGFTPRYFSGLINYAAMLQFEGWIAGLLPIQDKVIRHSLSGAISGGIAAAVTCPLSTLKDYTLAQSRVNKEGRLETQNSFTVIKRLFAEFSKNPKQNAKKFISSTSSQLTLRIGLGASVFSIVAGAGETLGPEPLKNIIPKRFQPSNPQGFFNNNTSKVDSPNDYSSLDLDPLNPFK